MARSIHVLVVEDDPATAGLLEETLGSVGRPKRVTVANDGSEALDLLRRGLRPDLILLDLKMPQVPGSEVLQSVKSDPSLAHVPVVVLTTSDAEDDIARCLALHANSFVIKPSSLDGMRSLARAVDEFWTRAYLVTD